MATKCNSAAKWRELTSTCGFKGYSAPGEPGARSQEPGAKSLESGGENRGKSEKSGKAGNLAVHFK